MTGVCMGITKKELRRGAERPVIRLAVRIEKALMHHVWLFGGLAFFTTCLFRIWHGCGTVIKVVASFLNNPKIIMLRHGFS